MKRTCGQCGREGQTPLASLPPNGWTTMLHANREGLHVLADACSPQCAAFLAHSLARGDVKGLHGFTETAYSEVCRLCSSSREKHHVSQAVLDAIGEVRDKLDAIEGRLAEHFNPAHDHRTRWAEPPAPVYASGPPRAHEVFKFGPPAEDTVADQPPT